MKAGIMAKRFISVMALLMAIMLLFTACGGGEETSSNASNQSQQPAETDSKEETPVASDDVSGDAEQVSSQITNNSTAGNSSNNAGNGQSAGGDISDYKNAPKKEVHVLMWREYTKTEQSLVDGYMKKTGVKIRTTVTTENEYPTKLVSLVAGGDSPDVVQFNNQWFPGLVVKSLQPLNTETFQLDNNCWHKTYMDPYKINGKYYGVAMAKTWNCEDCAYVTYYNPAVLKQCGISKMPFELYKQGKWNWEEQSKIAKQVAKFGQKNYIGLSLQSNDIHMHSAGVDFVSYNGKKFTDTLGAVTNASMLTKAWKEISELYTEGTLHWWALEDVQQGKVGLFSAIAYGLYNEGNWFDNVVGGYGNLQAVPVAGPKGGKAYTPVRPKVWGVAKKAKNPEGAAYFLRYFLDVNNINLSSTFYNKQFETVYGIITDKKTPKSILYGAGVIDYKTAGTYSKISSSLSNTAPANIATILNSKKGIIDSAIERANKDLGKI